MLLQRESKGGLRLQLLMILTFSKGRVLTPNIIPVKEKWCQNLAYLKMVKNKTKTLKKREVRIPAWETVLPEMRE